MVFCSTMELRPESLIPSSHAVVFSGATLLFQKIKEEKKKFGFLKKSCACFKHSNLFKVKGLGTPESAPPRSPRPHNRPLFPPQSYTHRTRHPSIPPWSGIKTDGWKESGEEIQEEEEEEVEEEEEEEEGFFLGVTSRGLPEFGRKREKEGGKKRESGKKKRRFFSPP